MPKIQQYTNSQLQNFVSEFKDTFSSEGSEAYLDLLLLGRGRLKFFSLIQAQNIQIKCLVIFKSGESLIFVVFFFFFNLIPNPLRIDFCIIIFLTPICILKVKFVFYWTQQKVQFNIHSYVKFDFIIKWSTLKKF
jgi:hypothetical protein